MQMYKCWENDKCVSVSGKSATADVRYSLVKLEEEASPILLTSVRKHMCVHIEVPKVLILPGEDWSVVHCLPEILAGRLGMAFLVKDSKLVPRQAHDSYSIMLSEIIQ